MNHSSIFSYPRQDFVAGVVVFLIALPLCLGIAIACGVPPLSGLVAGAVGGIVVPMLSRAPLSVSGPAAGLTSIVLAEISKLGSMGAFLTAVVIAGVLQLTLGLVRAGRFSALVPSSVIKGMLASIGITIVLKQLPVAVGVKGGLSDILGQFHAGAALITAISLVILYGWKKTPLAKIHFLPAALVVVVLGAVLAALFSSIQGLALLPQQFVEVPLGGIDGLASALARPDTSVLGSTEVWIAGLTIAVVASIETLLSLQAVDRLDPLKRHSPPDRELVAQGAANAISGLLGGLPLTSVIVRSGANVAAGGRERLSAMVHGVLLLLAVVFFAPLLNRIPLACLAAVLIQVGLNLCRPSMIRDQKGLGINQFLPFAITIAAVLALDLLKGVILGIVVGVFFVLRQNAEGALQKSVGSDGTVTVKFRRDATFLSKPALLQILDELTDGARLVIDGTGEYIDQDIKETLAGFMADAQSRKIEARLVGIDLSGAGAGGGH